MKNTNRQNLQKTNYGWLERLILTFSDVKNFLPEIALHIRLYRSSNEFVLTFLNSSSSDEKLVAIIERASLFVTKMDVKETVLMTIENALVSVSAEYPYIQTIIKSFIVQAGQNSFVKEIIFRTEPDGRLTFCMTTNEQFRRTRNADAFHYRQLVCRD